MVHDVKVTMLMANGESREIITVRAAAQKGFLAMGPPERDASAADVFSPKAKVLANMRVALAAASSDLVSARVSNSSRPSTLQANRQTHLAKQAVDNTLNILVKAGLM